MSAPAPAIDVALDARLTRQMSVGMKSYARELAIRLPRVAPDLRFERFSRGENFGFAEQVALPFALWRARPRVVHFLSLYAPLALPAPYVVTIHDLIHLQFPHYFKRKVPLYYRAVVRRLLRGARLVITDDARTVAELAARLEVDPARCRVVPLGVDDVYLAPAAPALRPRPYVLYAGNHREHKNLTVLFEAWHGLPEAAEIDVLLTGADDIPNVRARYARARGRIEFLGDLSADELARFYAGALAYVHPALAEGFGLPMLEAMAAGAPVIASEEAVPGVLRPAARTFAARDPDALQRAMLALCNEPQTAAAMRRRGRELATMLTWDHCAAATANIYREILEGQPTR